MELDDILGDLFRGEKIPSFAASMPVIKRWLGDGGNAHDLISSLMVHASDVGKEPGGKRILALELIEHVIESEGRCDEAQLHEFIPATLKAVNEACDSVGDAFVSSMSIAVWRIAFERGGLIASDATTALLPGLLKCIALKLDGANLPVVPASCAVDGDRSEVVHRAIVCDGCGVCPIVGVRFKCSVRFNYDLCASCAASASSSFSFIEVTEANGNEQCKASAASCLRCMVQSSTREDIDASHVSTIIDFYRTNAQHKDWSMRDAASTALGSLVLGLHGKTDSSAYVVPHIQGVLPRLITATMDAAIEAKNTAIWVVTVIVEIFPETFGDVTQLVPTTSRPYGIFLLMILIKSLESTHTEIQVRACKALNWFAENNEKVGGGTVWLVSHVVNPLLASLRSCVESASDVTVRISAYECMTAVVSSDPSSCEDDMAQLGTWCIERRLGPSIGSRDCSFLLGILYYIIGAADEARVTTWAPTLMRHISTVLIASDVGSATSDRESMEEAFLVAGKLADRLQLRFTAFMDALMPSIILTLASGCKGAAKKSSFEYALGALGDVLKAVPGHSARPYVESILPSLQRSLEPGLMVVPAVLSIFGDVALGIGDDSVALLNADSDLMASCVDALLSTTRRKPNGIEMQLVGLRELTKTSRAFPCPIAGRPSSLAFFLRNMVDERLPDYPFRRIVRFIGNGREAMPQKELHELRIQGVGFFTGLLNGLTSATAPAFFARAGKPDPALYYRGMRNLLEAVASDPLRPEWFESFGEGRFSLLNDSVGLVGDIARVLRKRLDEPALTVLLTDCGASDEDGRGQEVLDYARRSLTLCVETATLSSMCSTC